MKTLIHSRLFPLVFGLLGLVGVTPASASSLSTNAHLATLSNPATDQIAAFVVDSNGDLIKFYGNAGQSPQDISQLAGYSGVLSPKSHMATLVHYRPRFNKAPFTNSTFEELFMIDANGELIQFYLDYYSQWTPVAVAALAAADANISPVILPSNAPLSAVLDSARNIEEVVTNNNGHILMYYYDTKWHEMDLTSSAISQLPYTGSALSPNSYVAAKLFVPSKKDSQTTHTLLYAVDVNGHVIEYDGVPPGPFTARDITQLAIGDKVSETGSLAVLIHPNNPLFEKTFMEVYTVSNSGANQGKIIELWCYGTSCKQIPISERSGSSVIYSPNAPVTTALVGKYERVYAIGNDNSLTQFEWDGKAWNFTDVLAASNYSGAALSTKAHLRAPSDNEGDIGVMSIDSDGHLDEFERLVGGGFQSIDLTNGTPY